MDSLRLSSLPSLVVAVLLPVGAACARDGRPAPRAEPASTPARAGAAAQAPGAVPTAPSPPVAAPASPDAAPVSEALVPVPADVAAQVTMREVVSGLARPVALAALPGERRLLVAEQHTGRVRVVDGGRVLPRPVLELRGELSTGNEQGLLDVVVHPGFPADRRLFVSFTDRQGTSRVVEFKLTTGEALQADLATRRELFSIEQPYANHNGGNLEFGPDGRLYLGLGDGGAAGDPLRAGQDEGTPLGKLVRFDVGAATPRAEIVARGLRNPWRFSFDAATGDLYVADVGQDQFEWVHVAPAGALDGRNFGWSIVEGRHCYRGRRCDRDGLVPPVIEYTHDEGCSITGGVVYRGRALPALAGAYLYADYCTALLRSFRWARDGVRDHWDWKRALDPEGQLTQVSSFGVDADGEPYVLSLAGGLYRVEPAPPR